MPHHAVPHHAVPHHTQCLHNIIRSHGHSRSLRSTGLDDTAENSLKEATSAKTGFELQLSLKH